MIPKIIHYCWLSDDQMPKEFKKNLDMWHKLLLDYKFVKWDFTNFPKGKSKWVDQAFERKKYAFAADYIRLYALYYYGGIYLDLDVEVLKPFDDFLDMEEMLCYENSSRKGLEVAILGVSKNRKWIKQCLDWYSNQDFVLGFGLLNTKVLPEVVKDILIANNWNLCDVNNIPDVFSINHIDTIPVFSYDFFSPKSYETGKVFKTNNTYTIHHFASSWHGPKERAYKLLAKIIGKKTAKSISNLIKSLIKK